MNALPSILLRSFLGFLAGWVVADLRYYFSFAAWDGVSLDSRDIGALTIGSAFFALGFVAISLVLGLIFLIKPVSHLWNRTGNFVLIPIVAGTMLVAFATIQGKHPFIWIGFELLAVFPIVHWPRKEAARAQS